MEFINKLAELIQQNNPDTLEYIEDLNEMREIQQGLQDNKELRQQFNNMLNTFYLSNGIFNKINSKYLNDEQKTFISLLSQQIYQPTNRYRQQILKYYTEHIEDKMENINLENIAPNFARFYYSMIPGLNAGYTKYQTKPMNLKPSNIANYIPLFIKIGECLQFDVEGFPKNEMLYLLYGLAVYFASFKEFKTFKDLVNFLQSFIQLNLLSKCFNSFNLTDNNKGWNLVTFIEFKRGISQGNTRTENFRYKIAKKYISEDRIYNHTKLMNDDKGLYILTEMTGEEINKTWEQLEELYKNKKIRELINLWFDSQLMTRSTCLIGCMLIIILNKKLIKFAKDEMPDWKAILSGTYEGTYTETQEIPEVKDLKETLNKNITLNDVLYVLYTYYNLASERLTQ